MVKEKTRETRKKQRNSDDDIDTVCLRELLDVLVTCGRDTERSVHIDNLHGGALRAGFECFSQVMKENYGNTSVLVAFIIYHVKVLKTVSCVFVKPLPASEFKLEFTIPNEETPQSLVGIVQKLLGGTFPHVSPQDEHQDFKSFWKETFAKEKNERTLDIIETEEAEEALSPEDEETELANHGQRQQTRPRIDGQQQQASEDDYDDDDDENVMHDSDSATQSIQSLATQPDSSIRPSLSSRENNGRSMSNRRPQCADGVQHNQAKQQNKARHCHMPLAASQNRTNIQSKINGRKPQSVPVLNGKNNQASHKKRKSRTSNQGGSGKNNQPSRKKRKSQTSNQGGSGKNNQPSRKERTNKNRSEKEASRSAEATCHRGIVGGGGDDGSVAMEGLGTAHDVDVNRNSLMDAFMKEECSVMHSMVVAQAGHQHGQSTTTEERTEPQSHANQKQKLYREIAAKVVQDNPENGSISDLTMRAMQRFHESCLSSLQVPSGCLVPEANHHQT